MRNRDKSERLLDGIGEIRDEIIESAAALKDGKQYNLHILVALITLAIITPIACVMVSFAGGMGGNASGIPVNYNGNVYQSYRGPVFPLTAAGEIGGVTAERNITLDFSPYETQEATLEDGTKYNTSEEAAIITDTYTLKNNGAEPMSLELLYPYQSCGRKEAAGEYPDIQVDGKPSDSSLLLGAEVEQRQSYWEDYQPLVGESMIHRSQPISADTPVTVYTFSDVVIQGDTGRRFQMKIAETADSGGVFTSGLDGAIRQEAGDEYSWLYTGVFGENDTAQVVVVNGQLADYKIYAYSDPGTPAEATVTETETTLGAALHDVIVKELSWNPDQTKEENSWVEAMLLSSALQTYLSQGDGLLSAEIGNLLWEDRIFYRSFRAEIPAGGEITVSIRLLKCPSGTQQSDPVQAEAGEGADGYDMVTTMGTQIPLTALSAQLEHFGAVEIRDQSFGFDPEHGVVHVTLDPKEPEYYINVTKK